MIDHFQLTNFSVRDAGAQSVILVSGSQRYYNILRDAFKQYRFSRAFEDRFSKYDWGTYIQGITETDHKNLVKLLEVFQKAVCIDDALDQTFALNYHMRPFYEGGGKTELGELVYAAKPYHHTPNEIHKMNARKLAKHFIAFINSHPSYKRSDYLIAVPPSAGKIFDLPTFLVEEICTKLKINNGSGYVQKNRETKMKDKTTLKDKSDEIQGAFNVTSNISFDGKLVTIIDDIYQTGVTLHEIATLFQSKGAIVRGLTATKTLKDLS